MLAPSLSLAVYTGISPKTGIPNLFLKVSSSSTVLFKNLRAKTRPIERTKPKNPPKITFLDTFGEELPLGSSGYPIGYPELPSGSSSPNVSKNVILGGFFGFVLSIGLVFALKFLNNTVDDEETLRNKFGIPVLGEIPVYTANESEGANNV